MIARKELPAHLVPARDAFEAVLADIEPAKAGLTDVLPGTRLPGRPLRDAVTEFRDRLTRAQSRMPAWRCPELEGEWRACEIGLAKGLSRADLLLQRPEDPIGFEALLGTVEHLMDPLDPFVGAAERFRALRRRGRRTD
jgi:hypothetical protein